jgi:hypothetical protein
LAKEGHEFIGESYFQNAFVFQILTIILCSALNFTLRVIFALFWRQVSSSKEGPDSDFQKHIVDAEGILFYFKKRDIDIEVRSTESVDNNSFPSRISHQGSRREG